MRCLFVSYHDFRSNSAGHIAQLANRLAGAGHACSVAVPGDPATVTEAGPASFTVIPFAELPRCPRPDMIIAWTPRENVRKAVLPLVRRWRCPYVVHLEDNEDAITSRYLGVPYERVQQLSWWRLRPIRGLALSHPRRMRRFLAGAAGVSILMGRLIEFVPSGVRRALFWPGYDEQLFGHPAEPFSRASLDIDAATCVLVYTGNIHRGNADEMAALHAGVVELNRRGLPTVLVRTGDCHDTGFAGRTADAAPFVRALGWRPRDELPGLLAMADVLVQPGRPDVFNDYRFPSKLPEFLVSGRPVVLPATNIGRTLKDGEEAMLLRTGTPLEIAAQVSALRGDAVLARRIGEGGRAFAQRELRWDRAAAVFGELLKECGGSGS